MFHNLVSSPALFKLLMHKLISKVTYELSYLRARLLALTLNRMNRTTIR